MTSKAKAVKVFIGVGHGGTDPGVVHNGVVESNYNLVVTLTLEQELKRHGMQVLLSRYGEEENRLADKIAECNAYQPDFAIEIHTNAGGGSGFEVYHQVTNDWSKYRLSYRMAQKLQTHVQRYQKVTPREIKAGGTLAWLNQVQAPAVLCENFFVDGPNASVFAKQDVLKSLAKAYTIAILEYFGMAYHEHGETYWFHMIEPNWTIGRLKVPGILHQDQIYVPIRKLLPFFGRGIYYNSRTKESIIFPSEYYTEEDFASGRVTLDSFSEPEEEDVLTKEEMEAYGYEEIWFEDI